MQRLTNQRLLTQEELKVAEAHNTTKSATGGCGQNKTSPTDVLVQQEVSSWTLLFNVTLTIPASLTTVLITSWGDRVGRKLILSIPVAGMTISAALLSTSIYLNWSLSTLFVYYFLAGISGYYAALLAQGSAYLSDITSLDKRGLRFVILETALDIGGGIGGLSTGYWVKAEGFFKPVVGIVGISFLSFLLIPILPDSRKIRDMKDKTQSSLTHQDQPEQTKLKRHGTFNLNDNVNCIEECPSSCSTSQHDSAENGNGGLLHHEKYTAADLLRAVWKVYSSDYSHCEKCYSSCNDTSKNGKLRSERCKHGGGRYPGRVWRMWFYLVAYAFTMYVIIGSTMVQTIFLLSPPLCFTPILIGIKMGFGFGFSLLSPLIVLLYQRVFHFGNHVVIILALSSLAIGYLIMSFATQLSVVFLAASFGPFVTPGKSFIEAQISSLVSANEQGAAFALLSFTGTISCLLSAVSFLLLYSVTAGIYHGFVWLHGSLFALVPISLIIFVMVCDRRRRRLLGVGRTLDDENRPLLHS
ncbi:proton-coupled folate transporter-like isoform X2 [Clavelina lepadiformis]|uniref:proton-coupled folate transporter-like isoform X2 n=1 Tax=Clavelina lepadiformis TaxID=159417 RepID=UPI004041B7BC